MEMSVNVSLNRCRKFILTSLCVRIASHSGALLSPFKITLESFIKLYNLKNMSHLIDHRLQPFAGRIIFDHMPKTGGLAINQWLTEALGAGTIIGGIPGGYQFDLIRRYGGEYSIISAHLDFCGMGLDPRYQYITLLREPIDRALSWLYFVINNHAPAQLPGLWEAANEFISSEGQEVSPALLIHISNQNVKHFSHVLSALPRSAEEMLADALSAIEQYEVCGFYDEMPIFLADVAALVGLPAPKQIDRKNVTNSRPTKKTASSSLINKLVELNEQDLDFYRLAKNLWQKNRVTKCEISPSTLSPMYYAPERNRKYSVPEISILSVSMGTVEACFAGQELRVSTKFSLARAIGELEIGIGIIDDYGRWALGTNTTLLNRRLLKINEGTYCMEYLLNANFPEGQYTVTIAFAERVAADSYELCWQDKVTTFNVSIQRGSPSIGYSNIPVEYDFYQLSEEVDEQGFQPKNSDVTVSAAPYATSAQRQSPDTPN